MLAHRENVDIANEHHLVVILLEHGIVNNGYCLRTASRQNVTRQHASFATNFRASIGIRRSNTKWLRLLGPAFLAGLRDADLRPTLPE